MREAEGNPAFDALTTLARSAFTFFRASPKRPPVLEEAQRELHARDKNLYERLLQFIDVAPTRYVSFVHVLRRLTRLMPAVKYLNLDANLDRLWKQDTEARNLFRGIATQLELNENKFAQLQRAFVTIEFDMPALGNESTYTISLQPTYVARILADMDAAKAMPGCEIGPLCDIFKKAFFERMAPVAWFTNYPSDKIPPGAVKPAAGSRDFTAKIDRDEIINAAMYLDPITAGAPFRQLGGNVKDAKGFICRVLKVCWSGYISVDTFFAGRVGFMCWLIPLQSSCAGYVFRRAEA